MSHSNFLLDPLLLQEDERNKKKVPFIKQEQEEEQVYYPVSTNLGNTPELKYEDDYKSGSFLSLPAEGHDIRNDNSDRLPSCQQDRKSSRKPQYSPTAQPGSSKSPQEYDQYVGDLTSLQKYQPGASDHFRPSLPQAGLQTGESESSGNFPPSTDLQSAISDLNRLPDGFYYDTGDVSQAQIPEPGLDLDEYPDLQPGVITMNLPTPATTQEVSYLQSWIPRNRPDIENFYASRPGLSRPILEKSSKRDQLDTVMRHMLAEHGAIIDERQSIQGRYDQLGAVLIDQYRIQNPEDACELQRQGDFAFSSSPISQRLSYPSGPHSGIRNYPNQSTNNDYEAIGGPDVDTVKKWGGIKKKINNKGVYHEVLHRRRKTLGAKYHPITQRMMDLPYSTGETLTDQDILQLSRLSPLDRHLRASKFFNERGEFYTRHIRFTEMSDARLRREGLLRAWIPRKAGDRPHNSIERAERAIQLGLTGDDKLFADAAAERLRRAKLEQKMRESKAAE